MLFGRRFTRAHRPRGSLAQFAPVVAQASRESIILIPPNYFLIFSNGKLPSKRPQCGQRSPVMTPENPQTGSRSTG